MNPLEWARTGENLPLGGTLQEMLANRPDWQIWRTDSGYALIVSPELHSFWLEGGFLEPGVFLPISSGAYATETDRLGFVSSAEAGPVPQTISRAEGVLRSFLTARSAFGTQVRLVHALYVSSLPYVLPVGSGADTQEDKYTLGRWLTGGMNVPFTDEERMLRYAPALTLSLYREMLSLLGWQAEAPQKLAAYEPAKDTSFSSAVLSRVSPKRDQPFTLAGRPELERFLREQVLDIIDKEEAYRRMGIGFPGPTLLVGPPGCGKTYAVQKLAEYLGWPVFEVNASSIASMYIHETGRLIAQLFKQAEENAPAIVVIDEMEAYLSSRGGDGYGGIAHTEEMAEFLRVMPSLPEKHILLFGMTNMPDRIDPAILRKGRFDHVIQLEMATREEMAEVLMKQLCNVPTEQGIDYLQIGGRLAGRPISDAVYVSREAGRLAVLNGQERIDGDLLLKACGNLSLEGQKDKRLVGFR